MKRFIGIILFISTQIVTPVFNILGIIYACFRFKSLKEADDFFFKVAGSEDQHSNLTMKYFFNDTMIKKDGYKFGNPDEKISSVYGKNQKKEKLTWFGYFWGVTFLNKFEKDHSLKSIDESEKADS